MRKVKYHTTMILKEAMEELKIKTEKIYSYDGKKILRSKAFNINQQSKVSKLKSKLNKIIKEQHLDLEVKVTQSPARCGNKSISLIKRKFVD